MKFNRIILLTIGLFVIGLTLPAAAMETPQADIHFSIWLLDGNENFARRESTLPLELIAPHASNDIGTIRLFYSNRSQRYRYSGPLPIVFYEKGVRISEEELIGVQPVAVINDLGRLDGEHLFVFLEGESAYHTFSLPDLPENPGEAMILNMSEETIAMQLGSKLKKIAPRAHAKLNQMAVENGRLGLQLALFSERHGEWRRFYEWQHRVNPDEAMVFLIYRLAGDRGAWRIMPIRSKQEFPAAEDSE